MNNITLLFGYNNYYNRKMKKESTVADYKSAATSYLDCTNVENFNVGDGVSTSHIFNLTTYVLNTQTPDYMIIYDDSNNIMMRWFVIDSQYIRAGQYKYNLYRDVVAESWSNIQSAPIFVEKGILAQSDPMILNSENMTYNQVKTTMINLADETSCPWIVGYMTQDAVEAHNPSFKPNTYVNYDVESLNDYVYYNYSQYGTDSFKTGLTAASFKINTFYDDETDTGIYFSIGSESLHTHGSYTGSFPGLLIGDSTKVNTFEGTLASRYSGMKEAVAEQEEFTSKILKEDGKVIRVNDGSNISYWKVSIQSQGTEIITEKKTDPDEPFATGMKNIVNECNNIVGFLKDASIDNATKYAFSYTVTCATRKITLTQMSSSDVVYYKISSTRNRLSDQPYSMFCMPYGRLKVDGVSTDYKEISSQVAADMSSQYGGSSPALYDLQLLPYCPIRDYISGTGITLTGMTEGEDYDTITRGGSTIGYIFWSTVSKGTFDITQSLPVTEYKVDNETKTYRLCSPNYQGQFEFSAAKNGGVTKFNVDFTYKPYSPYIHLNPNFGKLYGRDFDDARGLICGGKFDLPQTSDAWATYERSNANYQTQFNRQIENLEVQQGVQRTQDIVSIFTGAIQGAGAGAAMGSVAGGGVGAGIGAAAGGLASALGGVADYQINEKLRKETMDYTKDMYGYQLGNIKAMPEGLTSVGSLTNNNNLFPFVEIYEATTQEVTALKNKIIYNGMTVMRIGTITEFKSNTWTYNTTGWNYFKGKLIRADIDEDWHFIDTLKAELDRGIFIEEES